MPSFTEREESRNATPKPQTSTDNSFSLSEEDAVAKILAAAEQNIKGNSAKFGFSEPKNVVIQPNDNFNSMLREQAKLIYKYRNEKPKMIREKIQEGFAPSVARDIAEQLPDSIYHSNGKPTKYKEAGTRDSAWQREQFAAEIAPRIAKAMLDKLPTDAESYNNKEAVVNAVLEAGNKIINDIGAPDPEADLQHPKFRIKPTDNLKKFMRENAEKIFDLGEEYHMDTIQRLSKDLENKVSGNIRRVLFDSLTLNGEKPENEHSEGLNNATSQLVKSLVSAMVNAVPGHDPSPDRFERAFF